MRHRYWVLLCGSVLAGLPFIIGDFAMPAPAMAKTEQASAANLQAMYLEAEKEEAGAAVPLWEALLKEPFETVSPGITRETVRLHLVHDLINAAEQEQKEAFYTRALSAARALEQPRNRAWAMVLILRSQLLHDKPRSATATYAEILGLLPDLKESDDYSYVANGLVQALLTPKDGLPIAGRQGLEKARSLIGFIFTSQHRAEAWRSIALAELMMEGDGEERELLSSSDMEAQTKHFTRKAQASLNENKLEEALRYALAVPFTREQNHDKLLQSIQEKASLSEDYALAIRAISGIQKADTQSGRMVALVDQLIEKKELTRADHLARMIDNAKDASDAMRSLARAYQSAGYTARAQSLGEEMLTRVAAMTEEPNRRDGYAAAATFFAEAGWTAKAQHAIEDAKDSARLPEAMLAMATKLAEQGKMDDAIDYYEEAEDASPEMRGRAAGAIAKAYAERGEPEEAADFLSGEDDVSGEYVRRAQIATITSYIERGEVEEAEDFLEDIVDPAVQGEGKSLLARLRQENGDEQGATALFKEAGLMLAQVNDKDAKSSATLGLVSALSASGRFQDAVPLFNQMNMDDRARGAADVVQGMVERDSADQALAYAERIADVNMRDAALSKLAITLAQRQDIRTAVRTAKQITEMTPRVVTLRQVAETQAKYTDFYRLLQPAKLASDPLRAVQSESSAMTLPASLPTNDASATTLNSFEEKTIELIRANSDDVLMRSAPSSDIGRKVPTIRDKEKLSYNTEYVRSLVPASDRFKAGRTYYQNSPYNLKFHFAAGNADFVARQGTVVPDMITLESGVVDLALLYDHLHNLGLNDYIVRQPNRTYLLRRPLIIGPNATLVVSGSDTAELRLSVEAGAYIVNSGRAFFVDTRVMSWSEENQRAAIVEKEANSFRPFYASWSHSETNMANTDFTGFGYSNSKSYGLSISSGPRQFERMQSRDYKRPTGIIVDNSFRNFLYGFYSYEADNVVLVGNEYIDNLVYGIDPHDRSRWLMIAYNTAYDTHKKHGIIISREVNNSTILGNITFDNHGSGLMVDRFSSGTMIYANTSFENGGDGLTVFESSCKLIASNRLFNNKRAGIRIRNSMDIGIFFNEIRGNRQAAVQGYVIDLKKDPAHRHRDFELDPYTDVTALSMVGNWIERNEVGIMASDLAALYLRNNQFQAQSPKLLRGSWEKSAPRIFSANQIEGEGIFITDRCVKGTIAVRHHCGFRDEGYFAGDGQDRLIERIDENYCQTPVVPAQSASTVNGGNG